MKTGHFEISIQKTAEDPSKTSGKPRITDLSAEYNWPYDELNLFLMTVILDNII